MRAPFLLVFTVLLCAACTSDAPESGGGTHVVVPQPGHTTLPFSFVDVAGAMGYTLRNETGSSDAKDFIVEAMPPGLAVADFDGDGRMDLFAANGNSFGPYDRATRKIALLPEDEAPRSELYLNRGDRFEAAGKRAGIDRPTWAFGVVAGDIDNDGDPDLYVCNWGFNRLYRNRGDGTFVEVAEKVGAAGDERGWSTGACFFDFDRDGDLDIYFAQYADMYAFFDNDKSVRVLPDGRLFGRTCDWRGLKVYCGPYGLRPQNDVLLQNMLMETGELGFVDVTEKMGMTFPYEHGRSDQQNSAGPYYGFVPVAWDIDGDGWQDLFVANDSHDNTCWMNQKGKGFVNDAAMMGVARSEADHKPQASMGVAVGDLNEDGVFDFTITEFSHDQFNLLIGERTPAGFTVFKDKAPNTGVRDMTFFKLGWGANFLDVDLDGDLDVFFACGHVYPEVDDERFAAQGTRYRQQNLLILNESPESLRFRDVSGFAGPGLQVEKATRASVAFDFDDDGDLDIATTELNDTPCLLRCDIDAKALGRHWAMVRLVGNPAAQVPRDPAGAVVVLIAGEKRFRRLFLIGSSFQSSEDPRLHFGLGGVTNIDAVEVTWPNGKTTRHPGIPVDALSTIVYPDR